jgi:cyclopropane-fatty-acyl-phospholipid synthase
MNRTARMSDQSTAERSGWGFSGRAGLKGTIQEILSAAGIVVNGNKPWDMRVKDDRFYSRVLREGSLGLGESYMEGWWECDRLDEFFSRLLPTRPEEKLRRNWKLLYYLFESVILNPGRRGNAFHVGKKHYDIGNELYEKMLDRRMVYSCAYWKDAQNLDDAQEAKLDLICRKLGLCAGDRILDIGCGWGSLLRYAAERYGVGGVGITVSERQAKLARENCRGLAVEIRLQDYRDINEKFDHVVSVGMFEHVGYKNYRGYMEIARRCLKDGGLFLLHTIGNNRSELTGDLWVDRYIFPHSMLPSIKQIGASVEGLFVLEDVHNLGAYYDTTLVAWLDNFEKSWQEIKKKYDEKFYRMWKYYLQIFAGAFRSRYLNVWQIVFSGEGVPGGYRGIR